METDTEKFDDQPDVSEPAVGSADPSLTKYVDLTDRFWHSVLNREAAVARMKSSTVTH